VRGLWGHYLCSSVDDRGVDKLSELVSQGVGEATEETSQGEDLAWNKGEPPAICAEVGGVSS
jgi:hypothetical protein